MKLPMLSIFYEAGTFGFCYGNGPCVHYGKGYATEASAQLAGYEDMKQTLRYAHQLHPRLHVDGQTITWRYKCACGLVINPIIPVFNPEIEDRVRLVSDEGPCPLAQLF